LTPATGNQSAQRNQAAQDPLQSDWSTHEAEEQHNTPSSYNLDADHDDAPLRFIKLNDILGLDSPSGRAIREVPGHLFMAAEEPNSLSQAEKDASWRRAMAEEINSIEDNNTWELVDLPVGHKLIGLKWVYKLKKNASEVVVKYKVRLVAKGYVQREGFDFEEVFALVAKLDSIRLLLALVAHEVWLVYHLDVKSVFLHDDLTTGIHHFPYRFKFPLGIKLKLKGKTEVEGKNCFPRKDENRREIKSSLQVFKIRRKIWHRDLSS
jgi:hypothetical protein